MCGRNSITKKLSRFLLCGLLIGASCRGPILATAELHGAGHAEVKFTSTGRPVVLWADTAGEWYGAGRYSRLPVHYEIDIDASGKEVGHITCDTATSQTKVCGNRLAVGRDKRADCEYKLTCKLPPLPAGEIVLKVTGTPGKTVKQVTKMSLNVREEFKLQ